jgi:hypothetical protein
MPNRQRLFMDTKTSNGDYTRPQQPYGIIKHAKKNA